MFQGGPAYPGRFLWQLFRKDVERKFEAERKKCKIYESKNMLYIII